MYHSKSYAKLAKSRYDSAEVEHEESVQTVGFFEAEEEDEVGEALAPKRVSG